VDGKKIDRWREYVTVDRNFSIGEFFSKVMAIKLVILICCRPSFTIGSCVPVVMTDPSSPTLIQRHLKPMVKDGSDPAVMKVVVVVSFSFLCSLPSIFLEKFYND